MFSRTVKVRLSSATRGDCDAGSQVADATHLDVADPDLWETISWELVDPQLLGQKAREHAQSFSQQWSKQPASPALLRTIMSGIMELNVAEYHDALGWTKTEE